MTRQLYELEGRDGRRYSLFSWRSRLALAHKGLAAAFVPVLMHDKPAIAFSGGRTVPILRDGGRVIRDSWAIACHLEETYPERPLFGGDIGRGVTRTFVDWVDRSLVPAAMPMLAADIAENVHSDDRRYFRESMEKAFGAPLEALAADRDHKVPAFRKLLAPLRRTLAEQGFVCGGAPAYADYVLFSVFRWAATMSAFDLLADDDAPLRRWRQDLAVFADAEAAGT